MRLFQRFLLFLLVVISAQATFAQRGPTFLAEQAFNKGDYYDAAALYKKAFTKEKNKVKRAEIIYKVAESYRLTNDYKNQEVWYAKAIKANFKDPEALVHYADALKVNGKYDEAIVQYTNFQKASPTDPRGELGISSSQQAQKWKEKPTRYKVENVPAINTKYSDFGANYSNKDHRHIIYTSARQESMGKNEDGGTGEKFQDLFEATVDKKGKWSSPKPLLEPINSGGNDGSATIDAKGVDMFFTRCDVERGKMGGCEIYYTKRKGQTWDEPKLIPLSGDSFTVGQPSLSADEQTLYFVSDMEGGQGGKDIWMTVYDKKTKAWGTPSNLGNKINTPLDEMFPSITANGTLYFSSKGHSGMGGLDIFQTKISGSGWEQPLNLRYPVNTSADDFAFILDELSGERGFLSSNREGGKGGDDIYTWYLPPLIFTISGRVYDADTRSNIEGASIELFGSDGTSIPFKTDATGAYKFDLKPETSYKLSATNKNYLNKYLEVSTVGLEQSKDFIGDFDFALRSMLRSIELPDIYYDLAKWDLRSESKKALDGLVETMNENPTIVIELGSHTDSRPIPMTNDTLSQRRAESVVKYLIQHGIEADRLYAKGYGAREPRVLDREIGSFKSGDVMTDEFISKLKSTKVKEEAHQLNRRTEFKVLRTNYVKGQSAIDNINQTPEKTLVDSSSLNVKPVEDATVATKVEVKDAAASVEAKKDSALAPVVDKTGPGEIYICKKADTYTAVAKKHGITVKELKDLNGIRGEQIDEGMELRIDPKGNYTEYNKKFYVLTKDDKKWAELAKKLEIKLADLKKLNKGVGEDEFHTGKQIRITK
ncbi:MAG: OmpA family protein [Bacteroidetes bacterium]|nr:OmpA family protein [Bacteroidota bacterium]MBK9523397.1 OmpA family protein [Bacteroidota bacterium]MBK9541140.1 OmpA family protein [Bacteroidota bacterium]MBP6403611.1 OmpA family protein [Bacteroidia bacterium]MBP6650137.1 OmpA family protein [Bacteroidia bacterium]